MGGDVHGAIAYNWNQVSHAVGTDLDLLLLYKNPALFKEDFVAHLKNVAKFKRIEFLATDNFNLISFIIYDLEWIMGKDSKFNHLKLAALQWDSRCFDKLELGTIFVLLLVPQFAKSLTNQVY